MSLSNGLALAPLERESLFHTSPVRIHDIPITPLDQLVYDGLGRLIVQKTSLNTKYARATHLYYDGVRRIMERYYEVESQPAGPLTMLMEALSFTLIQPGWYEWEYVWGPDYVDELAFVVNANVDVRYALQDANYNLVAWLKPAGAISSQYTYGPYGDLRAADLRPTETDFPPMGIGHQGLFFVRLDGIPDDPPLETGAHGLYYNRNRWYSPDLGRYITRDINGTAQPIITALAFHANALSVFMGTFSGQGQYADGMNLYLYGGANPVNMRDALGLFADDSWLDDFINDHTGWRIGVIGTVQEGARWASLGMNVALEIAISLIPGYDAVKGAQAIIDGEAGFWDYVAAGTPLVGPAAMILGKAFSWGKRMYKAGNFSSKSRMTRSWGCFVAGTAVLLADGTTEPIENIQSGDEILVVSADGLGSETATVQAVHEFMSDEIVVISFSDDEEPLSVTPEHPIWVYGEGWTPAGGIQAGDCLMDLHGDTVEVLSLSLVETQETVYNLTVGGSHTYYVTSNGLLVHNKPVQVGHIPGPGGFFEEIFKSAEDAIGITGLGGVKKVGSGRTKNADIFAEGFTDTHYYVDEFDDQWTVFYNPSSGTYAGAHLSSSNF